MGTPTNEINIRSVATLGYNFVNEQYLPDGKNEYYLREYQNKNGIQYRQLTAFEIEVLVRNRNTSNNWNDILVSNAFNPELVKNCQFYGLVRIGKLEPVVLEFSDLKLPVGLYNSTIISTDFGDNVAIDNVNYLSHYIIGSQVIIVNVNELVTSSHAKFGNGILKDGEGEDIRIWLELCNENGGRKVIPFNGMLAGDAYLWTKYRGDGALLEKFKAFTQAKFDTRRGYYGKIGDRTVIKNCRIIKDVWVGSDAYIKGANKLKNITVNSGPEGKSQIGEGVEMVNGIMGYGCRAFYGVKAVRFVMGSHSQLKYGARLINSFLGDNSTISCCEVLNSLIFPAHEQHHNNSFLTAANIMGLSNIAAGATIGSNHNSRSPDGELLAGRGFWPGLCVSLKHNSKFATFTMLSKGDYPAELDIPIPFSLVSNDVANNRLVIMPGYWFLYNMYALERNGWKYGARDKRKQKIQYLEYDYLAPDSMQEVMVSLEMFKQLTGFAWYKKFETNNRIPVDKAISKGLELLESDNPIIDDLEITGDCFENSRRKTVLIKVRKSYNLFKELVSYYLANQLIGFYNKTSQEGQQVATLPKSQPGEWVNVGGQLIGQQEVEQLIKDIHCGVITSWNEVHKFYEKQAENYQVQKLQHALALYEQVYNVNMKDCTNTTIINIIHAAIVTREWMTAEIYNSREKDYSNRFRKMMYDNQNEMDAVVGKLEDNSFILQQKEALEHYKIEAKRCVTQLKSATHI